VFVIATIEVPDQERQYYAGPVRMIAGRKAHKVTHLPKHATRFETEEEAEAVLADLDDGYHVVAVPP
jgi:hypothetical protein